MGIKLIVWWLKPRSFLIKMAIWIESRGRVGMFIHLKYAAFPICVQVKKKKTVAFLWACFCILSNASVITSMIFFHVAD